MFNSDFYNPTCIIFGKDRLESLGVKTRLSEYGVGADKIPV